MKNPTTDKIYRLTQEATPLVFIIPSGSNKRKPLLYWDDNTNTNRPLRYARNQKTPFEDEQDGNAIVEPVVFEDGFLSVPKTNPVLQKFLHYHPLNGSRFEEINLEKDAASEIENINIEVDALIECRALSLEQLESVARILLSINPDNLTTAELKRDMILYVRNNPSEFLRVVNDPNLKLQSKIQKFFNDGLLSYRRNKTEVWYNAATNKKKLFTVPFGEDAQAMAASYLLSDEGLDYLRALESLE
tara:strand:- start:3413 stop:4150 length:738 start_codon:yes stop_codon:yes gene_type:complete